MKQLVKVGLGEMNLWPRGEMIIHEVNPQGIIQYALVRIHATE
jgi:hypothetical protein